MSPCTLHRWSESWSSSFAPVHFINAGMDPFGAAGPTCAQLCGTALPEQTEHGAMLPVLCYSIEWIKNVLILLPFQLRVLYKYYSAGIMHMNKVSWFSLGALSECGTSCHWCIWLQLSVLSASYPDSQFIGFAFLSEILDPEKDLTKMCMFYN